MDALPHSRCPLCGGANACAPAACGRLDVDCWCRRERFGAELLARVPAAERGRACICAACVTASRQPAAGATATEAAAR